MTINENESDAGAEVFDDDGENFTVDFGNVEEAKRTLLPVRDYEVQISELEFKLSASSNKPMWSVVLEVQDEGDFNGRKIYTNLSFSEKALSMTKGVIKVIAPELLEGAFKPREIADNGDLLGKFAKVRIKHRMYEGEKQVQVSRWMPSVANASANAFIDG